MNNSTLTGGERNDARKQEDSSMGEKTVVKSEVVKRIREMSAEELHQLPRLKAKLVRNVFKKSDQVNMSLKVEVGPDFTHEFRLTEEQYAVIKLSRSIAYDKQDLEVYGRVTKGVKQDGSIFMMLEVVPVKGLYFNELLNNLRIRQIEILSEKNLWPQNLVIKDYPDAVETINSITDAE